jgi:hypothetical protein
MSTIRTDNRHLSLGTFYCRDLNTEKYVQNFSLDTRALGNVSVSENNIKVGLRGIRFEGVCWFQLVRDAFQWRAFLNMVSNPWGSIILGNFLSS